MDKSNAALTCKQVEKKISEQSFDNNISNESIDTKYQLLKLRFQSIALIEG